MLRCFPLFSGVSCVGLSVHRVPVEVRTDYRSKVGVAIATERGIRAQLCWSRGRLDYRMPQPFTSALFHRNAVQNVIPEFVGYEGGGMGQGKS